MRVAGLASGMDIDSMVKSLMEAERMPLNKLKQRKQILEWQRDDIRTINTSLLAFRDKLAALRLTHNYRARTTASSNEDRVSATVTSGASQASYSISQVTQLATAATRVSTEKISNVDGEKINPAQSLYSQNLGVDWQQGVLETKTINVAADGELITIENMKADTLPNIRVNGQGIKVVDSRDKLEPGAVFVEEDGRLTFGSDLKKNDIVKIDYVVENKTVELEIGEDPISTWNIGKNSIASATVTVKTGDAEGKDYTMGNINNQGIADLMNGSEKIGTINTATGIITFDPALGKPDPEANPDAEAETIKVSVKFTQNYTDFKIDTHTSKGEVQERIFITGQDSMNSVIRKVNESSAGVTMFYDSFSERVTLTRKETGNFNESGDEIQFDGAFIKNVLKFEGSTEEGGDNAEFVINGLTTQRNANTFEMNGVTFTLKQVFEDGQAATVSIGNDSEQVFENIKEFVNQYNELIAEISKKLNEERNRSYQPLTDVEREELSDKQQEQWEELARSGLLKGDPILSGLLSAMRIDMSNSVETNGLFRQLASIGIKTTANYMDGGKLEIDEAKLKEALEQDPEAVENLFRGTGEGNDRGVVHRLYDTVDATMKKLQERAGRATSTNQQFTIGRELLSVDKSIDRFEQRLKMTEDRYWRQFTAMERAIQRSNEQSMFLMQQFYNA